MASHRYWRLLMKRASGKDAGAFEMCQMALNDTGGTDRIDDAHVAASATTSGSAANLYDDNTTTTVWNATEAENVYIIFDFEELAYDIDEIEIYPASSGNEDRTPGMFEWQYSDDGLIWNTYFYGLVEAGSWTNGTAKTFSKPTVGTSMRYWALYMEGNGHDYYGTGNPRLNLNEWELRDSVSGTDQIGAGTLTSSDDYDDAAGFDKSKVIDGSAATWWASDKADYGASWLKYDFGSATTILETMLKCRNDTSYLYTASLVNLLASSDGITFDLAFNCDIDPALMSAGSEHVFSDTSPGADEYRFYRLWGFYAESNGSIYGGWTEIDFFDETDTDRSSEIDLFYPINTQAGAASNLVDGNTTGTLWQTNGSSNIWCTFDFGYNGERDIQRIRCYPNKDAANRSPVFFVLQGSNDRKTWTDKIVGTNRDGWSVGTGVNFYADGNATGDENPARYWMVMFISALNDYSSTKGIGDTELRASTGGADETGAGTAFAGSTFAGTAAADAFDGDATDVWSGNISVSRDYIGYDFGGGDKQSISEIALTSRNDGSYAQAPLDIGVYRSADGKSWTKVGQVRKGAQWTQGEQDVFSLAAVLEETLAETIGVAPTDAVILPDLATLAETIGVAPADAQNIGYAVTVAETIGMLLEDFLFSKFIPLAKPVVYVNATSISDTIPSGIDDEDSLVLFLMRRDSLSVTPAGWTLKSSISFTLSATTQYLDLWQKDDVSAADGGTTVAFTQATSGRMGMQLIRLRSLQGGYAVAEENTGKVESTSAGQITMPTLTATQDNELFLGAASQVQQTTSDTQATPPTGMTLLSGLDGDHRISSAWQRRDSTEANSGVFDVYNANPDSIGAMIVRMQEKIITISDQANFSVAPTVAANMVYAITLTDGVEGYLVMGNSDAATAEDTVGISPFTDMDPAIVAELADALGVSPEAVGDIVKPVAAVDTFRVIPILDVLKRQIVTMEETGGLAPAVTYAFRPGYKMTEGVEIEHTEAVGLIFGKSLAELIGLLPALTQVEGAILSETIGIEPALNFVVAAAVLEEMGIDPSLLAIKRFGVSKTEGVSINATLARFLGMVVTDDIGVDPALSVLGKYAAAPSETIGIEPAASFDVLIRVTVSEGIGVDMDDAAGLVYAAVLNEEIEVEIATVAPDGSVTAWAMNTRNAAVTEYTNFDFNSFARMGNKYLGANAAGVYELNGDDDAGTDITATLRSGLMQFDAPKLMHFEGVYLGIRGTGEFVFKLIDKDGNERVYEARTNNLQTSKVWIGKGVRLRYWAFELSNAAGQDFDLESVEFVPMVAKRRV